MDEKDRGKKSDAEDTEGNMPRISGLKLKGEKKDAEALRRKSLTPEGTEEKGTEEDDTEGHRRKP
jgi:hypothetical protein